MRGLNLKDEITNAIYLKNEGVVLDGLSIWGTSVCKKEISKIKRFSTFSNSLSLDIHPSPPPHPLPFTVPLAMS